MCTKSPQPGRLNAYIVDCLRTAGGRRNGSLSGYHPAELCATVIDGLLDKVGVKGSDIDDVIVGCVSQVGAQAANVGRNTVLSSTRLPATVPGTSVDRQCGSGQQAIHFAAQAVMSGFQDCIIAGGVESMSTVPINACVADGVKAGHGFPYGDAIWANYGEDAKKLCEFGMDPRSFNQFGGAELVGRKWKCTREEYDRFAVLSQDRASVATKAGKFKDEIFPVKVKKAKGDSPDEMHVRDEGIRATTYEKVAALKPMYPNGLLTAASSSQICDGAAAVLICNEVGLKRLGLIPRAKIVGMSVIGADPVLMLEGPVFATDHVLRSLGLKAEDVDLCEVNEAFAPIALAVAKAHFGGSLDKINVNGGAMALGHPLGATGAKLMTTLVHELERRQGQYGLLAICEGGGTANATIIERVPRSRL